MKHILIFFLLLSNVISAQNGSITGKIADKTTGEDMVGVVVQIESLGLGAASDLFGTYEIKNIPPGTYDLKFSFVSYNTKIVTGVIVQANQATQVDAILDNAVVETGTIEIVEIRKTNSEAAVIMDTRDAKSVVSGVSGKTIAKSQDPDAAAVAKRIPGVTIVDNRFVMVRGLQERYNAVMLNGALAPSLETDVKSFSFDLIPSGLIDRFLIYKSPSADLPGEFAGGAINVVTRNFPENNFEVKAGFTLGYRDGTTGKPYTNNLDGDTDWLGFDNGSRALPENFATNVRDLSASELQLAGRSLSNSWSYTQPNASPDLKWNVNFGRIFDIRENKFGTITSINYSKATQAYHSFIRNYNVYDFQNQREDTTEAYDDFISQITNRIGVMQNFGFKSKKHDLSFKNFFNQSGLEDNTLRTGKDIQNGILRESYQFRYMERTLYTGQLSGTHKAAGSRGEINWLLGYNHINRSEPDIRRIIYQRPTDDPSVPYQANVSFQAQPFYMGRLFMDLKENSLIQAASYAHYFNWFKKDEDDKKKWVMAKAGIYHENKQREFSIRNLGYKLSSSTSFNWSLLNLPVDSILMTDNINNTNGFVLDEDTKGSDTYNASNSLTAYYAMLFLPINKWNITAGIRIEDNTQKLNSESIQGEPVAIVKHVVSPLPSLNISYNLSEKHLLRFAYGRTINRPEFRELAPFSFYDFVQNFVFEGNPELEIPKIDNIDLRWEAYPTPGEIISAGVFYKNFQNPIELSLDPTSTPWNVDPYNAVSSFSYGVEIDIRKNLRSITNNAFLQNFSVVANASWIESEVKIIQGESSSANTRPRAMMYQSPYVVNSGIYYQNDSLDLSVNILYNVIGERIFLAGINGLPDVYEMPRNVLDFTITKGIGKHIDIRFGIQDILNQKFLWLQDGNETGGLNRANDQQRQYYQKGSYYTFGISYEFSRK